MWILSYQKKIIHLASMPVQDLEIYPPQLDNWVTLKLFFCVTTRKGWFTF
jgi:hypothetical protein